MSMTLQSSQLSWLAGTLMDNRPPRVTEKLLGDFYGKIEEFRNDLERLDDQEFQRILPLSRETPTHYKWHMFTAPDKSFTIWLHEYKPHVTRADGYAQTIHNHRYPMSALLLAGGYRYTRFAVQAGKDHNANVRVTGYQNLAAGSVYSMRESEFHSVTEIRDGTVSLLIQGRPLRPYSTSVDAKSCRTATHVPIEGRLENLRTTLIMGDRRSYYAQK